MITEILEKQRAMSLNGRWGEPNKDSYPLPARRAKPQPTPHLASPTEGRGTVYTKVQHLGMTIKAAGYSNDVLFWRVPNLGGALFASVGLAMEAIRKARDKS